MINAAAARPAVQDSSKVAYVPRADGPVDTSAYMWGGYAIAAAVYVGYVLLLLRRMARLRAASARMANGRMANGRMASVGTASAGAAQSRPVSESSRDTRNTG